MSEQDLAESCRCSQRRYLLWRSCTELFRLLSCLGCLNDRMYRSTHALLALGWQSCLRLESFNKPFPTNYIEGFNTGCYNCKQWKLLIFAYIRATSKSYIMSFRGMSEWRVPMGSPLFGQENVTNETFSCTEAVDAWCQSDPASAAQQQQRPLNTGNTGNVSPVFFSIQHHQCGRPPPFTIFMRTCKRRHLQINSMPTFDRQRVLARYLHTFCARAHLSLRVDFGSGHGTEQTWILTGSNPRSMAEAPFFPLRHCSAPWHFEKALMELRVTGDTYHPSNQHRPCLIGAWKII
jgi:hypothetical protein